VGGGYPDDLLAQRPLEWLLQKAKDRGLLFKDVLFDDPDEREGQVNNSFSEMAFGLYAACHAFIPYQRKIGQTTTVTPDGMRFVVNETIDQSVFGRWAVDQTYRPKNLKNWASQHQVDPGAIKSSVRADDPSVVVA
jgi:hypothetical protein